ncbi:OmpA family protein [Thalassospira alkalitolerans]|uniref:OmpA family protein n=1 Tax=Thalassospira alkalitolerans TaxID=1293890 RepID=UPI0030EC0BA1|tara:strand:+ start:67017 stop:67970 length:954 start_codon:yes stop_codon:yes gene_type:complete
MAKKPAAGAPAWMATFADLMSLLLVLFVLLLTFAEMDVVKYKQIAGSVKTAFGFSKEDQLAGVVELDGSILGKALKQPSPDTPRVVSSIPPVETPDVEIKEGDSKAEKAEALEETLGTVLKKMGMGDQIGVERKEGDVIVRFPNEIAFPSGSSGMTPEFAAILNRVVPVINQTDGQVVVAGHTDNIPVSSNSPYISNWDLSAARATSVLHHMIDQNGTDPRRMVVQGYGDSRPITENSTAEGRAQNRRVEIIIEMMEDTGQNDSPLNDNPGNSLPTSNLPGHVMKTDDPADTETEGSSIEPDKAPARRRSFSIPGHN